MKTIIAAFSDASAAQQGAQFLTASVPSGTKSDVEILRYQDAGSDVLKTLEGRGIPDERAHVYAEVLRRGAPILIAHVPDDRAQECADTLDRMGSLDLDAAEQQWRSAGWKGYDSSTPFDATKEEEVLDVIEEKVSIGKRAVERGGVRVRTFIVERPVREQVELREERIDVTREAVDEKISPSAADSTFREDEYVVTAQSEEAVVGKEARVVERVHVGKRVENRTENIEETERKQEVDVESLDSATDREPRRDR